MCRTAHGKQLGELETCGYLGHNSKLNQILGVGVKFRHQQFLIGKDHGSDF